MNLKDIIIIALTVICVALVFLTKCSRDEADRMSNNIAAMNDTIETFRMKNGELMYEKQSMILKNDELETMLGVTKDEVRDLERKLGGALSQIAKLEGQVRVDTIHMTDSVIVHDDEMTAFFSYNDEWLNLSGTTNCLINNKICNTTMDSIVMFVPLKVGMSDNNKVFVTTSNPYVSFTDVDAADLKAKSVAKRWSLSLQFGVGPTVGYGLLVPMRNATNTTGMFAGVGFFIGIGASYRIF